MKTTLNILAALLLTWGTVILLALLSPVMLLASVLIWYDEVLDGMYKDEDAPEAIMYLQRGGGYE